MNITECFEKIRSAAATIKSSAMYSYKADTRTVEGYLSIIENCANSIDTLSKQGIEAAKTIRGN